MMETYLAQLSYTPCEIAKICEVKSSTVYAWISRNELASLKLGKKRKITNQQLAEFLQKRRKRNDIIIVSTKPNA
jgi:excisionase family DNA binding protein